MALWGSDLCRDGIELELVALTMGLADGADEVHKATVARRVLCDYSPQQHP